MKQQACRLPPAHCLLDLAGQPGESRSISAETCSQWMKAAVVDQWKEQLPHPIALWPKAQLQLKVNPFRLRLLRDPFQ